MARLAYRFATASPRISAANVEAQSFPELARKYGVRAVPHSVLNETEAVVGAVPEAALLEALRNLGGSGGATRP
jgi:predicted DsbA family dithiol-disulfide isomerase